MEHTRWDRLYANATSGTTDRVIVFQDDEKRNWDRAADLLLQLQGNGFRPGHRSLTLPPDACYEHCGADGRMVTYSVRDTVRDLWRAAPEQRLQLRRRLRSAVLRDYLWREKRLGSLGVDGTRASKEILDEYCSEIRKWKPQVLRGLPVTLYVLAKHAQRIGFVPHGLRSIRPNGGKFTQAMVQTVEEAFAARVRENYGTAELGTVAFDCARSRQQHLLGDLFYIEFLRRGEPVGPGELGEMVVTDLRNRATPLIRYAVGDVGRYATGKCECGFEGLRFSVEGRLEETIVTPDGHVISGAQVTDLFLARPEIEHVKVTQLQENSFMVETVLAPDAKAHPDEAELAADLSSLLQSEVEVRLRVVRGIAPERSGKYRLVVGSSHGRFHQPVSNLVNCS
jgi:phenylacetate-coenzyme A ligase PaaK-like adenylate-forming protein